MRIRGELWGRRIGIAGAKSAGDVLRIVEHHPDGPAENAWIFVEQTPEGRKARYISWINYYDVEFASRREPGRWSTVEPPAAYEGEAEWRPYGWGSETLPNTAHAPRS